MDRKRKYNAKTSKHFNDTQLELLRNIADLHGNKPNKDQIKNLSVEFDKPEKIVQQYFYNRNRDDNRKVKPKTKESEDSPLYISQNLSTDSVGLEPMKNTKHISSNQKIEPIQTKSILRDSSLCINHDICETLSLNSHEEKLLVDSNVLSKQFNTPLQEPKKLEHCDEYTQINILKDERCNIKVFTTPNSIRIQKCYNTDAIFSSDIIQIKNSKTNEIREQIASTHISIAWMDIKYSQLPLPTDRYDLKNIKLIIPDNINSQDDEKEFKSLRQCISIQIPVIT